MNTAYITAIMTGTTTRQMEVIGSCFAKRVTNRTITTAMCPGDTFQNGRCNDHLLGEYGQVAGSAQHPSKGDDMVCSAWRHAAGTNAGRRGDTGRGITTLVEHKVIYGMGWRKFITYAKTQYGVTFTEKEAKRIRDAYFVKYAGLARWHKNTREYVMRHGYVRSFSGLVRHLPMVNSSDEGTQQEAIRQGINSPVQEFGSTLGVIALGRMNEEVDPDALQIIGFIHDALYAYVRKEHLEWGLKTLGYYMESADLKEMFGLTMRIPIKSDPSFGLNMGDQFELADFPRDDTPYDWGHECLRNPETGELLIEVPEQEIPENDGMLTRSPYTTPDDLEPETAPSRRVRMRRVGVRISEVSPEPVSAAKRVSRSKPEPVVKRVTRSRG